MVAHEGQSFCFAESMRTNCTILSSGKSSENLRMAFVNVIPYCSPAASSARITVRWLTVSSGWCHHVTSSQHISSPRTRYPPSAIWNGTLGRQWLVDDDKVQHSPMIKTTTTTYSMEYDCQTQVMSLVSYRTGCISPSPQQQSVQN